MSAPHTITASIPEMLRDVVTAIGRPARYGAGERLFSAGDSVAGIHVVVAGAVRIVREGTGRAVVMHRELPGGLLGEVAFFGGGVYPGTAVATEPTECILLPAAALRRYLSATPSLAEFFLGRLARRTQEIIARLDRLAHQTVLRRLASHLAERQAQANRARHHVISLGMTQAELAEELGTVKEVIVRELRALCKIGVITPQGRGLYRIVDSAGLRAIAGESAPRV